MPASENHAQRQSPLEVAVESEIKPPKTLQKASIQKQIDILLYIYVYVYQNKMISLD